MENIQQDIKTTTAPAYEILEAPELAARWKVPVSWVRSYTRERTPKAERIPCLQFGRYVRFEFGSPQLEAWLAKHRKGGER